MPPHSNCVLTALPRRTVGSMKTTSPAVTSTAAVPAIDPAKIATPDGARADMVQVTGSGYTPVRHDFVQKHDGRNRASTLARLCSGRKKRALILYLMLLTLWRPDLRPIRSTVWLRLVTVTGGNLTWSSSSLSETWTTLVDLGLAERKRVTRMAHVLPRREDAHAEYSRPTGRTKGDRYFVLPGDFWTGKWFDTLSLPAICMLLILLKETNDNESEFHITHEQVDEWYGISASSAAKGLKELEDVGLVTVRHDQVPAGLAAQGYTFHLYYSLTGAFSTAARKKARAQAAKAVAVRAKATARRVPTKRAKKPSTKAAKS